VLQLLRDVLAQLPVLAELDLDDHEPVAPALESPQPEEVQAAAHVVVRDLAVDEQELARRRVVRDEDRPKVSSSLWLTSRIAVEEVPIRP